MVAISIWHLIILLFIAAVAIASVVVPILKANPKRTLSRKQYAIKLAYLFAFTALMKFTVPAVSDLNAVYLWLLVILGLVASSFHVLWSVHRAQDAKVSKWFCLALLIPFFAPFLWLFLLTVKPPISLT